jgi:hypothetical protein
VLIKALKFKGLVSVPQNVTIRILFILHIQSTNTFITVIITAKFFLHYTQRWVFLTETKCSLLGRNSFCVRPQICLQYNYSLAGVKVIRFDNETAQMSRRRGKLSLS